MAMSPRDVMVGITTLEIIRDFIHENPGVGVTDVLDFANRSIEQSEEFLDLLGLSPELALQVTAIIPGS